MSHFGFQQVERVLADVLRYINRSLAAINAPDPAEHGWVMGYGDDAEPEELLQCVNCRCKRGCESNRCGCKRANYIVLNFESVKIAATDSTTQKMKKTWSIVTTRMKT